MAKLLINWLNNEVKLSSTIYSLEEDFKDGYLLGELLYKYNQQLDFDKFIARNHPDSKIKNFCLVEPTMRNVGVNFGSKIAADVMAGREGAIKTLLYELKTALDSIDRNSRQTTNPNLRGTRNDKILYSINPTKPSFDKTKSVSFENAIRTAAENPNEIMMRNATEKYREKKADFRNTVDVGHSVMLMSMSADIQKTKNLERTKKVNEGEFEDAWHSINLNQWKENQRIARERRNLKKRVEFEQTQKKEKKTNQISAVTRERTFESLDEFDRRLDLLIVTNAEKKSTNSDSQKLDLIKSIQKVPGGGGPTLMYVDQLALKEGFDSSQKEMKEHHENGINRQKMHDRRRRKFLREYDTMQTKLSHNFFEDDLVTQLLNECKDEAFEEETRRKVGEYQKVILENRTNRITLIEAMKEVEDVRRQQWQQIEATRELQWVVDPLRQSQLLRRQVLHAATNAANRQQSNEVVAEVIDKILDMSAWVISCRLLGAFDYKEGDSVPTPGAPDEGVLSPLILKDAFDVFASPFAVAKALPIPEPIDVSSALVIFSISQRPKCVNAEFFSSMLQSYNALSVVGESSSREETVPEEAGSVKSVSFWRESKSNELTTHLSNVDSHHFFSSIAHGHHPAGFDEIPATVLNAGEQTDVFGQKDAAVTPQWLVNTAPRFILGETVIAIRCAVDPIPDEPEAVVDTSHIPLRCALSGVSDLQRQSLAEALKRAIFNIKVIKLEDLIQEAIKFDATTSIEAEIPLVADSFAEEVDTESEEYKEAQRVRQMAESYARLSQSLKDSLLSGSAVSDDISVALIIHEIKKIPPKNNGFVIQDFPNTKSQLVLLMKGLSGIDYESPRPDPADKASLLAPIHHKEKALYDTGKCGLDCVIYLHATNHSAVSDKETPHHSKSSGNYSYAINERVTVRKDLTSGNLVYITPENCQSVAVLKELYNPSRPVNTAGIDISIAERSVHELVHFAGKLQLLDSLDVSDFSSLSEAVEIHALRIRDRFIPADHLDPTYFDPPVVKVEELAINTEVEEEVEAAAENDLEDGSLIEDGDVQEEAAGPPPFTLDFPPLRVENAVPKALASALAQLWTVSEGQSETQARRFFTALRDIRYQMLQRRRIGYDCINKFLVCIDNRQQLIHDFRVQFNAIDEDMRFDADCVAQLGLRNLELCDGMARLSEAHKKEAEDYVKKFSSDAAVQVMIHQGRCEAAAFVQTAVHLFNTSLHLLFDVSKAVTRFDLSTRVANELEITLPLTDLANIGSRPPSSKQKGKEAPKDSGAAKKGKDPNQPPPIVAFREPVLSSILPREVMRGLPVPVAQEAEVEVPKGKKLPAGKSKSDLISAQDPFEEIEKTVLELLKIWGRETFVVNRQLYEKDEAVCSALEHAVWFEAEKLKVVLSRVKHSLVEQTAFLENLEKSILSILNDVIQQRYMKELASNNVLYTIIQRAIEDATQLEELWQVTPDAVPINPRKFRDEALARFNDRLPHHMRQQNKPQILDLDSQNLNGDNKASGHGDDSVTRNSSQNGNLTNRSSIDEDLDIDDSETDHDRDEHDHGNFYSDSSDDNLSRGSSQSNLSARPGSVSSARRSNSASAAVKTKRRPSTAGQEINAGDEKYKKELLKYNVLKKRLEDKLQKRRAAREEEFKNMGMSPAMAKLAAYNELLLDEQHKMEDFEMINKPKHHSNKPTKTPVSAKGKGKK